MRSIWEGMEAAVAVADAHSFSGGAKLLQVSTSHVSKMVARLEEKLKLQLFNRTTRIVELTDVGRAFVDQSRRLIQERDEFLFTLDGSGEVQGELRLTCSIALGERFVAPIVRAFTKAHPRLSVSLDLTNRVVDLVGEGYDLAIRTGEISDRRLAGRHIALRPIATCASPEYLRLRGEPLRIADLDDHACLTGSSTVWHFNNERQSLSYSPKGRWRCNSGTAVLDAALSDMGVCQLPQFYVREHFANGRLKPILTDHGSEPEQIWAVYAAKRHVAPKVRQLVDILERELPSAIANV